MTDPTLEQALRDQLERLPLGQQQQVLEFARGLVEAQSRGVPGLAVVQFTGPIDPDDLAAMAQAIEDGCEKVNLDAWQNPLGHADGDSAVRPGPRCP